MTRKDTRPVSHQRKKVDALFENPQHNNEIMDLKSKLPLQKESWCHSQCESRVQNHMVQEPPTLRELPHLAETLKSPISRGNAGLSLFVISHPHHTFTVQALHSHPPVSRGETVFFVDYIITWLHAVDVLWLTRECAFLTAEGPEWRRLLLVFSLTIEMK